MNVTLRPGTRADAKECGRIEYEAFKAVADQHNFPPNFPSVEVATERVTRLLAHPGFYAVVAELDGKVVGCNFLDERSSIAGIGPIAVDPATMNSTIGRQLMQTVMDRATTRRFPGMRLVQIAWHHRSLALYTKLGFDTRETLSALQGKPLALHIPGHEVRPAREADLSVCNEICVRNHGHDRGGELLDAIRQSTATVVERRGRITGYATGIGWFHHAIGETNEDVEALIGAASAFVGPGFLIPSRNGELFRWCLHHDLRVVDQATLMTIGLYNEPDGRYLPSILY
jgi:predicted N-acetyltransferase YhbS